MQETTKYKLKKPGESDYADVAVLNENMDKVEEALGKKPDKTELPAEVKKAVQAGTLTAADLGAVSAEDKGKPNGVAGLGADGKVPQAQLPEMDYAPASHATDKNNPHEVTAAQVGAPTTAAFNGHTGDGVKHVTAEERTKWNGKADQTALNAHVSSKNNPHRVTPEQIGAATMEQVDERIAEVAPPKQGLPVNDIRTLTVRAGQSIKAGDVVDVENGEIFATFNKYANVNHELQTSEEKDSAMIVKTAKISDKYSVCAYCPYDDSSHSNNPYLQAVLLDNSTKVPIKNSAVNLTAESSYTSQISIAPISETHFVVAGIFYDHVIATLCKIELSNNKIVVLTRIENKFSNQDYTVDVVKLNSSNKLLMVSSSEMNGFYNILQVNGDVLSVISEGNSFTALSSGSLRFVNILSLGENKVVIAACGSSDKPAAVVGTFNNSTNKMSFGTASKDVFAAARQLRMVNDGNTIYAMCYLPSEGKYIAKVLTVSENTISVASQRAEISTENLSGYIKDWPFYAYLYACDVFRVGNKIIFATNSGMEMYQYDNSAASKLKHIGHAGWPEILRGSWQTLSISPYSDSEIWYGYSISEGSGNYATATAVVTPLTVHDNVFANWKNGASTAIALTDGTGGQKIPVGFGGYCECPDVTAGQRIDSAGVSAVSPQDGWLDVKPAYFGAVKVESQTYIGTGKFGSSNPNKLTFSFVPKLVIVQGKNESTAGFGLIVYPSEIMVVQDTGSTRTELNYVERLDNEKTIRWYSDSNPTHQLNLSGGSYVAVAIG
ncbi:MAG: hypothetical protein KH050_12505 [Clostridiaceae bacterium]|nr:hypothetical protein [Clostridiaceae bacterium]